jgi:manganese/iron transport system permease protein
VSASLTGVYLAFFLDSAPAPTIGLLLTATFVATFLAKSLRAPRRALEPAAGASR